MRLQAIAAALIGVSAGVAWADRVTDLTIGDKAPAIDIEHWVKGDKVPAFEKGKIYVVEFWATWCGPCRMSMPHISEMQKKYKDYNVTFIGVSDEKLDTVKTFLDKPEWAEKTHYTLTTDPDGSTAKSYMQAAKQSGIPTAFVVGKDSTIQWIGHPMSLDEGADGGPLAKIVRDEWDAAAFRTQFENEMKAEAERGKRNTAYMEAVSKKDWAKAVAVLDEWIAAEPTNPQIATQKFKLLLGRAGDSKAAYAYANDLLKKYSDNYMALNDIAWFIVDDKNVQQRDFDVALRAAATANDLSKGEDAAILDTLARVYWEKGDKAKAIETQKKAVAKAPAQMAEELKKSLEKYEGR